MAGRRFCDPPCRQPSLKGEEYYRILHVEYLIPGVMEETANVVTTEHLIPEVMEETTNVVTTEHFIPW
jgi:hypothetical protein